jgi:2-polyprenyl-6-hydroxyphenyl methylase/3-demethylubiquinone-9 3-methyltransferase
MQMAVDVGAKQWKFEVLDGQRFEFGRNWNRYLEDISEDRIRVAEASLEATLGAGELRGKRFLDVGSGSGLFSLAAHRLGATVHSFDFDPESVRCTAEVRRRYGSGGTTWEVDQGSVLDRGYLDRLGLFEVVYSWGVLHHTGDLYAALENAAARVAPGGALFIAVYNDQGRTSRAWFAVKRAYNALPNGLRCLVLGGAFIRLWGPTMVRDATRLDPLRSWRAYGDRGMSPWRDVVDWVGGWPCQVAKPEEIFEFLKARGFTLQYLTTCAGGHGCNEYVFRRA